MIFCNGELLAGIGSDTANYWLLIDISNGPLLGLMNDDGTLMHLERDSFW